MALGAVALRAVALREAVFRAFLGDVLRRATRGVEVLRRAFARTRLAGLAVARLLDFLRPVARAALRLAIGESFRQP
jgi:hypothetical protein